MLWREAALFPDKERVRNKTIQMDCFFVSQLKTRYFVRDIRKEEYSPKS